MRDIRLNIICTAVTTVFALFMIGMCFGVCVCSATSINELNPVVSETSIYINFDDVVGTLHSISFDCFAVDPLPLCDNICFDGLGSNETHYVFISFHTPFSTYYGPLTTVSVYEIIDYVPLFFLFLIIIVCLYLGIRQWVFLAPAAWLSISLIYFVRENSYLWYFEVLGGLLVLTTVVIGVLILMRKK